MSALDAVTATMLVRLFIPSRNIQLTPHCKFISFELCFGVEAHPANSTGGPLVRSVGRTNILFMDLHHELVLCLSEVSSKVSPRTWSLLVLADALVDFFAITSARKVR